MITQKSRLYGGFPIAYAHTHAYFHSNEVFWLGLSIFHTYRVHTVTSSLLGL